MGRLQNWTVHRNVSTGKNRRPLRIEDCATKVSHSAVGAAECGPWREPWEKEAREEREPRQGRQKDLPLKEVISVARYRGLAR